MDTPANPESAFEQAKKYGEDLAKLYAIEKAKRVNLQISNQKLQAIFSTTPDGLAVLNARLAIQEANPAFWSLVERPVPDGSVPLADVLPFANLLDPLKQPADDHHSVQVEVDLPLTKTMWRSLLVNAVPLSAGKYHGWLLSAHDLTERKRLENLKSEFINIAAHELRTPLAAVLGFSQVLKETLENDDGLAGHLIDTILQSSNRLKDIIDELIEFADIRYQSETTQGSTTFDIISTIKTVLENVRRPAEEKEIRLITEFPADNVSINGNRNILQEAIRHIVENAITFNNPGGSVTVRVADTPDHIAIEVEDTGIGIAQKEQAKIFDKFYQVEEHLTRSVGGLGLGLAIAQRGVQLHNGEISVRSALNEGSCFTVTLPKIATAAEPSESDVGLRDDFHQTLVLGKDFAKVVASERKLAHTLKKYHAITNALRQAVQQHAPEEELLAILDQLESENSENAG